MDAETFAKLADLVRTAGAGLDVVQDDPKTLRLDFPGPKPPMFAAVMAKKSYVSLHVLALYQRPEVVAALPDVLRARMQGLTCFNFKRAEQVPEAEVAAMLKAARALQEPIAR